MNIIENSLGVAVQGYIPVRKDPHEGSEMITQVLFGEYVDILDDEGSWIFIKMQIDNYEGWIDKKCIEAVSTQKKSKYIVSKDNIRIKDLSNHTNVILPIGSAIPELNKGKFLLGKKEFLCTQTNMLSEANSELNSKIFEAVISTPYIWGGRSGFGFDCSGLTQYLARINGKNIPRDSSEQAAIGETLSFIDEVRLGDLAFFDDTEGLIHHVGMIIENKQIIHASGRVRTDKIDQQGIFNEERGIYTYKLRVLKRIL